MNPVYYDLYTFSFSLEPLTEEQQAILKQKSAKIERLQTDITNLSKPLFGDDAKEKGWTKHITPGVLSVFQDNSSWNKLTLKPGNPVFKQQQQQHSQELQQAAGSNWKKVKDVLTTDISDGDDSVSESEPATTKLNYRDMKTYGNLPMKDEIAVVNCKSCHRSILASSFKKHVDVCIRKGNGTNSKLEKKTTMNTNGDGTKKKVSTQNFFSDNDNDDDEEDDDDHMGTLKQNNKDATSMKKKKKLVKGNNNIGKDNLQDEDSSANSKRPPPNSMEKGEKKKMKKEKSKTKTKQKAPLDLDKQCGVIQQPNGLPCTRSLTCKSHSMGAKRAVAGRSQPYDVLLQAYQKKAIGRPQSGAVGALTGKNTKMKKVPSSTPNGHVNGSVNLNTNHTNITSSSTTSLTSATTTSTGNNEDYLDSDDEVENVMQALRSNHPAPLAQKPYFYVKRQRQCYRLRDILLEAITPKMKTTDSDNGSIHHHNLLTNSNTAGMSTSGFSVTTPVTTTTSTLSTSQHDSSYYPKTYSYQDGGLGSRNHQLQQQQQQSSSSSSPISATIGYPGIYNSMDGLSPTSPSTSSVVSTYSIR
ncbi:SCA7, zinc-binding domain-containing protein [Halteromyces radiatus]|uniref:SCA7, zinc-binding domain-containing protein n=1 Tax=Halteromyces radiatus TaxID=101107 RepID=UPI00221FE317|nr:SCA7, zinc-binding domain-containing protein [Halteromyces radiatus]KAI8099035.1 SCA7, zinc-binding domain-containing protein [Halteromyces radiatus]